MNASTSPKGAPLKFFLLVFALAIPFWLMGAMAEQKLPLPFNLPVGALVLVCPMIAALILVYRENRSDGVKQLLKRSFDFKRIKRKIWYIPIFFLMPSIIVLEYGLMKLMGVPIPNFQFPVLMVPVFFMAFFLGAIGEELGWTGYATDPLQDRWTALEASLILGTVWAIWHVTPFVQAQYTPIWVLWQSASTVVLRVLIVWIYNNTGKSVFAVILFHAIHNVCRAVFPTDQTHNPLVDYPSVYYSILAIAAVIMTFLWGPKTLARFRYARRVA